MPVAYTTFESAQVGEQVEKILHAFSIGLSLITAHTSLF